MVGEDGPANAKSLQPRLPLPERAYMAKPKVFQTRGKGGVKVTPRSRVVYKRQRPGKRKPAYEEVSGFERSRGTGALVEKRRVIDRERNRYSERVVEHPSGRVLRDIDEPLMRHRGKGSAKIRRKP